MRTKNRGWAARRRSLVGVLLALATAVPLLWRGAPALAQTQIADTVQYANGSPAQGSVLLSWPAFTTAAGAAVPKGSATVVLGAGGALNTTLAANAGATPIGTFYTVVYHLSDGTVSREYWSVPVSAQPVKLAAVRTAALPSTVAVQTVSKQYVDQAIARAGLVGTASALPAIDTTNAGNITSGTLSVAQSSAITGDCVKAAGSSASVCTKTNGVPFAASATADTTNAANISSGQLAPARMCTGTPAPGMFCDGSTRSWTAVPAPTGPQVVSALGFAPAPAGQHLPGALAFYDMLPMHLSGTTVLDGSGNGNNATLNAGATPGSTGIALSSTGSIALPAALNGARTWEFAVELPSVINIGTSGFPTLLGSTSYTNGYELFLMYSGASGAYETPYALTLFYNGFATGVRVALSAGRHVIVVTLGSSSGDLDRFYLDGVEYGSYSGQAYSAGKQAVNSLNLGAAAFNVTIPHTVYEFVARAEELTAPQVQAETVAVVADMQARGLVWNPNSWTASGPYRIHIGDSLTAGLGATLGGWTDPGVIAFAATTPAFTRAPLIETAQAGITSLALLSSVAVPLQKYCGTSGGPNIVTLWNGTNSFVVLNGYSAEAVARDLAGEVALARKSGCVPYVATMISRTGNDIAGNPVEADKNALNALIRSRAKLWGATGVIDLAADPNLGADGANTNTAWFNADHTHLTDAGYALVAAAAARAIDYSFGYNEANPHVVSAAAYTMGANDGTVDLQPSSSTTVTLPSCIGQSGAAYRIANPQSAFAVVLKSAAATQPVNGVDYSGSGLTVPSNATVTLRDVPNAGTAGGCHWEM